MTPRHRRAHRWAARKFWPDRSSRSALCASRGVLHASRNVLRIGLRESLRMNPPGENLQRLPYARPRMEHRVLRIAEDAMVADGRDGWVTRPETGRRVRVAAHRAVEDHLGTHRDDVLDAEAWPILGREIRDIVAAG